MATQNISTDEKRRPGVYKKIGFLQHINDEFLNNQHCHKIQRFKRGEIINQQENPSDWIYIVIQGSVSVLKLLRPTSGKEKVPPEKPRPGQDVRTRGLRIDRELVPFAKRSDNRSYDRQLTIYHNTYQVEKRLEQTLPGYLNYSDRLGSLPYDSIIQQHKQRVYRKTARDSSVLPDISIDDVTPRDMSRRPSLQRLPTIKQNSKGFYLSVSRRRYGGERNDDQKSDDNIMGPQYKPSGRKPRTKGQKWKKENQKNDDYTPAHYMGRGEVSIPPTYILLTVLEKGQYFGLDEILFKNQPRCTLVSNEAVCGLVSKRSFLQQSDDDTIYNLRMSENPHPSTPMLRHQLKTHANWADHRARVYNRLVKSKDRTKALKAQFHPHFLGEYCFRTGPR